MKLDFLRWDPKGFWGWFITPVMWLPLIVLLTLYGVAKVVTWMG